MRDKFVLRFIRAKAVIKALCLEAAEVVGLDPWRDFDIFTGAHGITVTVTNGNREGVPPAMIEEAHKYLVTNQKSRDIRSELDIEISDIASSGESDPSHEFEIRWSPGPDYR